MQEPDTLNPYAPPSVDSAVPQPLADEIMLASRGDRFVGAFLDGLINGAFSLLIFGGLFVIGSVSSWSEYSILGIGLQLLLAVATFAFFMAINWSFLSKSGQTIGKKVAKTRIVTMDGQVPPMTDLVFKRYAFMQLVGLIPVAGGVISLVNVCFIFRRDKRCLHDLIGGTQVVKVSSTR